MDDLSEIHYVLSIIPVTAANSSRSFEPESVERWHSLSLCFRQEAREDMKLITRNPNIDLLYSATSIWQCHNYDSV